jgi:hypothetical protein
VRALTGLAALVGLALPAPAAATLAYHDGHNQLVIARDDGSAPMVVPGSSSNVSVSPNGRLVAYLGRGGLHVVDAQGRHDRVVARHVQAPFQYSLPLPWAPDSRHIAVSIDAGFKTGGVIADVRGRNRRFGRMSLLLKSMAFSPDSRRLAYDDGGSVDGRMNLYSLPRRRSRQVGLGQHPAWGRYGFAFAKARGAYLARRPGARARRLVAGKDNNVRPVAWSANGRWLLIERATGDSSNPASALIYDRRTGKVKTLRQRFAGISGFSHDGQAVLGHAFADGESLVLAAHVDGTVAVLARDAWYPSWSR